MFQDGVPSPHPEDGPSCRHALGGRDVVCPGAGITSALVKGFSGVSTLVPTRPPRPPTCVVGYVDFHGGPRPPGGSCTPGLVSRDVPGV